MALDEIEQHVNRIGRTARAIGDELNDQVGGGPQQLSREGTGRTPVMPRSVVAGG